MRICYLADAGSVLIQMRVGYFAQKNHDVHLITFRQGEIEGITLHYIKSLLPFSYDFSYILSIPKIRRLVREIKPDILHAYYATSYGFIGACCSFEPFVVSCMGSDIMLTPQKLIFYKWLTNYTLRKATFITSVSSPITEKIIKLGIEPQKIQTFPFGIDHNLFFPSHKHRKELILLSTRSLTQIYNIKTILESLSYLKKEDDFEGKLVIVGEGPERGRLKELAEDLGISSDVIFIGAIPHPKVADYLRTSKIYISMSLSDGTSTSLLEAMACGTFPIVSDIPANREWINDAENGFLVPVLDAKKLAQRIKEALSNTHLMQTAVKKNFDIIRKRVILQNNLGKMEVIYKSIKEEKW
jgi:glycosyltransferase involved in cell wall biosynthesis